MPERASLILQVISSILAAVVVMQMVKIVASRDPLARIDLQAALAMADLYAPSSANEPAGPQRTVNNTPPTSTPSAFESATTDGTAAQSPLHPTPARVVASGVTPSGAVGAVGIRPGPMPPGRAPSGGMPGMPGANVPPELRPKVEKITGSEIFGPLPRPMPMALLGIAGLDAFIRAPNGQMGLLREGEELGGLKLLRIGTNRVLVELEGRQQELMLFAGLGGESLLSQPKETDR